MTGVLPAGLEARAPEVVGKADLRAGCVHLELLDFLRAAGELGDPLGLLVGLIGASARIDRRPAAVVVAALTPAGVEGLGIVGVGFTTVGATFSSRYRKGNWERLCSVRLRTASSMRP